MSLIVLPVVLLGAAWGSFLNVVVLRFPDKSLTGRSYCPKCKKKLKALELIPIVSYLIIRGRCVKCHSKISWQYPLIELVVSFMAVILLVAFLNNSVNPVSYLLQFCIVYILLALFLIDLRTFLLPDSYILILTGLVILNLLLISGSVASAFLGALVGAGSLLVIWIVSGRRIGLGDVKLMIPIGLFFGPVDTVLVLYFAFIVGGLVGLFLIIFKKATMKTAVPFGPFLAGAGMLFLLFPNIPKYLLALIV